MNVLYLGSNSGTSLHRANAIRRIGHKVEVVDPEEFVPKGRVVSKFHWETGGLFSASSVGAAVTERIDRQHFDCTWVDGGRYVGSRLVRLLQSKFGPVINYNIDDPFGSRDRFSWSSYRKSVRNYDLVVVVRAENIAEAENYGANKVLRVYRSADEVAHAAIPMKDDDFQIWKSDVLFVGTAFPERGQFMARLLERGVPLSIYGNSWEKLKEWPLLKKAWKKPGTSNDRDYAMAIGSAQICLGLLSKENRDLHTTRTMEIPSMGSLFCAERTGEHSSLYDEGHDAFFWPNADECADICHRLLADKKIITSVADNGHRRFMKNGHQNEKMIRQVFAEINIA
jgi:spore maturation protein CgeB